MKVQGSCYIFLVRDFCMGPTWHLPAIPIGSSQEYSSTRRKNHPFWYYAIHPLLRQSLRMRGNYHDICMIANKTFCANLATQNCDVLFLYSSRCGMIDYNMVSCFSYNINFGIVYIRTKKDTMLILQKPRLRVSYVSYVDPITSWK